MKIRVSNVGYALLQGRIYRPHYLDPQNGIIHSSICLHRDTLKFCNAADLNPKTGTVRNATFVDHVSDSICKAVFGVSTLKAYEDAGFIKIDVPFCSRAYLCQTFLRSRFPDKQQREKICKQYGIDDSYATFEWHACFSYAILWGLENGYTLMGEGLLWNVYE